MPNVVVFDTATNVINAVAAEVGLTYNPNVSPYASNSPPLLRLCALLKSAGQMLLKMHEWQDKEVVYNLTTQNGDTGVYPLPADFGAITDQTGWQKSYFWPLRGPYSAQMWQRVVNYPTTGIYVAFRIQNGQLWLWPQPPPVGISVTFVYKTRGWVTDYQTAALKDHADNGNDIVNFDWLLITRLLKLVYLRSLGHDTTAAESEFKLAFDACAATSDGAAPELELARDARFPFITGFNSPDTGFGGQPPAGGSYL